MPKIGQRVARFAAEKKAGRAYKVVTRAPESSPCAWPSSSGPGSRGPGGGDAGPRVGAAARGSARLARGADAGRGPAVAQCGRRRGRVGITMNPARA